MLTTKGIVLLDATFPFTSRLPLAVNAKKVKIRVRITFCSLFSVYFITFPVGVLKSCNTACTTHK